MTTETTFSIPPDPFRNLRQQREKKKAIFEYDPFSVKKG